jgi:CheY-like chemotaxis protein
MISSSDILHSKILIVDDQEANIILLERMLHGVGYDSITSTMNPREVCELHRKNRYDLILLDLLMPDMDGFQVMEGLKEIEPQDWLIDLTQTYQFQMLEGLKETEPGGYLPVIVITAQPGHKLHALQAGARDFISKPFELAEVLARVRNMLEVRLLYVETKSYVKALEQKIQEVEVSRELIRRQSDDIKRLYDKIVFMGGDATPLPHAQAAHLHTLLYVEDNLTNLKLVEQLIAHRPDMSLLPAVTGNIGIEIARASIPDVILLDINLSGFNDFKFLQILHADPATAHIPVITISGNAMPGNIQQGLEAGLVSHLTKPIKEDEFIEALDVALEFAGKYSAKSK